MKEMARHTEATTERLWKAFQVNTGTPTTKANCETNNMLTLCILSSATVICFFLCRARQMTLKSKLNFFPRKAVTIFLGAWALDNHAAAKNVLIL